MSPVYLSGPMSGIVDHNYPMFNRVAANLRKHRGAVVYNPAENFGGQLGLPRAEYMRQDISHVLACACIVVLPGWDSSTGARLEVNMAHELDLPVWRWLPDNDYLEEVPTDGNS